MIFVSFEQILDQELYACSRTFLAKVLPGLRVIKLFMLNPTEPEIYSAYNVKMPTVEINCWHFNIYKQDKYNI